MSQSPSVIPFVFFKDGEYQLNDEFCDWLSAHDKPFAIASCAGKFRTGKSFLLNRICRSEKGEGFGVGETVQACTKGIWARTEMLVSEDAQKSDTPVLLLDTEGIDALDAECDHDVRIFSLAVLLSSVFIYNSMSHIDEAAVQTLSFMTKVASSLGKGHTPYFYWILRDFSLNLVDTNGNTISHSKYLETALDSVESKCSTREAIKSVFPVRNLVTLPRPCSRDTVRDLEKYGTSNKFDKFITTFRNHLCKNAPHFCAAGRPLSGREYVSFVKTVLAEVNTVGAIPKVEDAYTLMVKVQRAEEYTRSLVSLLSEAERSCPHLDEDGVRKWVQNAVEDHSSKCELVPLCDTMKEDLLREVLSWCCKAGRILTKDQVMDMQINQFFRDYSETRVSKEGFRHVFETLCSSQFFTLDKGEDVLDRLIPILDRSLVTAKEEGEEAATQRFLLRDQEMKSCLEDMHQKLIDCNDVVERQNELREQEKRNKPVMEDAEVQTENVEDTHHRARGDTVDKCDLGEEAFWGADLGTLAFQLREEALEQQVCALDGELQSTKHDLSSLSTLYDENLSAVREETTNLLRTTMKEKEDALSKIKDLQERCIATETESGKWRVVLSEVQDKTVEMHRTTLEELRRRDLEQRTTSDAQKDKISDLVLQADRSAQEIRFLKRKLDEVEPAVQEVKRLKDAERKFDIHMAKEDSIRETLLSQLSQEREERERLFRENSELNSRLAVSEASSRLESLRRNMYYEAKK